MSGHPVISEIAAAADPETLVERLTGTPGRVLLRSAPDAVPAEPVSAHAAQARYSFVTAAPFLTFRSFGSRCELIPRAGSGVQFGDPWHVLDSLMARYELLEELDVPFPLGGCFGYWGYDLKNFVEPGLPRRAVNDLELPDCHVGFYDSLVVFDHRLGKTWVISTGLAPDGSRDSAHAQRQLERWRELLQPDINGPEGERPVPAVPIIAGAAAWGDAPGGYGRGDAGHREPLPRHVSSNIASFDYISAVRRAQRYIRSGDIYQANLSHRLTALCQCPGWKLFERLSAVSPAPYAAFLDCGDFQVASSSPEQFLRMSGSHVRTRPIKGTRPRHSDPTRDAQLGYELQTSSKELAELVMITDLLRNDLGRVCEFGSVQVPDLARLEKFAQVQHLVSTVEGRLRPDVTHFAAFASCFPGGSITGAPKIRAMEIIDELEPLSRGPYTGALGYLGFNRESQLSIIIRTALVREGRAYFNVGAGIVADSNPDAEYDETISKAAGFLAALAGPWTAVSARG